MPLVKCHECGNEISTEAKTCPKCGAKVKKPVSRVTMLIVIALGIAFVGVSIQESGKSPEQKAAEEAEINASHHRYERGREAARAIKSALKNPSSAQWHTVLSNKDGSLICIEYGAQNGFGGMNREHAVFLAGKASQAAKAWNTNCANVSLFDIKDSVASSID